MKKIKDANHSTNDDKEKESNVDKEEVKNEKELDKKKEVVIENNLKEKEIEKEEQDIKLDDKVEEETIKLTSTNKQKINKKENGNFWQKNKNVLISIVITFAICLGIFGLFYNYYLKNLIVEKIKLEKSIYNYYFQMREFIKTTNFDKVLEYLNNKIVFLLNFSPI